MADTALDRIASALARVGLRVPAGLSDADQFATLVTVAANNYAIGRSAAPRRARLSLGGRPFDESKVSREASAHDGKRPGEFAPKASASRTTGKPLGKKSIAVAPQGTLNPDGSPKRTPFQPAARLKGKRGRFISTGAARRPGLKETHAATADAQAAWEKAYADYEDARDKHRALTARYESAVKGAKTEHDWAAVDAYREEAEAAKGWAKHQWEQTSRALKRIRAAFLDSMRRRVKNPAQLARAAGESGCPFSKPVPHPTPLQQRVLDDAHAFVAGVCHWPEGTDLPAYHGELSDDGRGFCINDVGEEGGGRRDLAHPVVALNRHFGMIGTLERVADRKKLTGKRRAEFVGESNHEKALLTHIHELGHLIEFRKPGVLAKARKFLAKRVAGETPVKLKEKFPDHGFDEHEVGRKDDFSKLFDAFDEGKADPYYCGKVYPHCTELVSMGLERLYDDPGAFAKADPEYYRFMVDVLTS